MPVDNNFSIQQCNSPVLSPAPLRSDLPTLKRFKDVGILAWQIAVRSQATMLWKWLTVRHYSTTCSHRTATAVGLISLWLFVLFIFYCWLVGWMQSEAAVVSRPPRSPARSPQPWAVSLSGPQMIRKWADPSGWNWEEKTFVKLQKINMAFGFKMHLTLIYILAMQAAWLYGQQCWLISPLWSRLKLNYLIDWLETLVETFMDPRQCNYFWSPDFSSSGPSRSNF